MCYSGGGSGELTVKLHVHTSHMTLMIMPIGWLSSHDLCNSTILEVNNATQVQGAVTYALPVEAFATGITMESSNQHSF